ncbi:sulfatase-like hydrolase/transferase [Devosia sp. A8/3-2]|nr:sulfatase-like hydrolase/transferase [Devosia sp. A8/3-2]
MGARRPNILWFCTDQQRFDTIGALGNPHVSTPNIDQLAAAGTAFTTAYCQSPICTPSRSSFLTGVYPSTAGASRNGNDHYSGSHPLVTRLFADAGYTCGNVGKLHRRAPIAARSRGPTMATASSILATSRAIAGPKVTIMPIGYGPGVRTLANWRKTPPAFPRHIIRRHGPRHVSIEFIRSHREAPWLLTVNVYDPHPPFNPPPEYRAMFDPAAMPGAHFEDSDIAAQQALASVDFQSRPSPPEELDIRNPFGPPVDPASRAPGPSDARSLQAAYYAMIKLIDDQFGRILAELDALDLAGDTIVVFTSDHGETPGDHGLVQKGCRFYEGLVRVPLIWRWPGHIMAGQVSDALVELIDKAPTLLDLAGLAVPEHMMGKTLRPLLEGTSMEHRTAVRCEYIDALDLPGASRAIMWRDRRYKLVVYHGHELGRTLRSADRPLGTPQSLGRSCSPANQAWAAEGELRRDHGRH